MRLFLSGMLAGWVAVAVFAFTFSIEEPACAIGLDKMNVFYCMIDNPVSIVVRGVPESEVTIEASANLQLQKIDNLHYNVRASTPGQGTIKVSGGRLQPLSFSYRIKRIPDPVARLGSKRGACFMRVGEFKAQAGIAAMLENFDFDARCEVVGYKVAHLRRGQLLTEADNRGARFNDEVQPIIDAAQPGDTYIFDEIKAKCPGDKVSRDIEGLTVTIN